MGGSDGGRTFESTPHAQSTVGTHHEPSGASNGTSVGRHTTGLRGRRRPTGMHRSGTAGLGALRRTALFCGYADPLRLATKRLSRLHRFVRSIDDSVARQARKCACGARACHAVQPGGDRRLLRAEAQPIAHSTRDGVNREWPRLSHSLSAYRAGCNLQRSAMPFATAEAEATKRHPAHGPAGAGERGHYYCQWDFAAALESEHQSALARANLHAPPPHKRSEGQSENGLTRRTRGRKKTGAGNRVGRVKQLERAQLK